MTFPSADTRPVEGTWERLADMPGGTGWESADSLMLPDGRIAVFRAVRRAEVPEPGSVVIYDPATDEWEQVAFSGEAPTVDRDQPFILGNDGRIYTQGSRISIGDTTWHAEPFELWTSDDPWVGQNYVGGPSGLIYGVADNEAYLTTLVIFDPSTGTTRTSATGVGGWAWLVPVGDGIVGFGYDPEHRGASGRYEPATDTWDEPIQRDSGFLDERHAAARPDGVIYLPRWNGYLPMHAFLPDTYAPLPETYAPYPIEMPDGLDDWNVDLLWHDDALFAFRYDDAWRFTPDG